MMKYLKFLKPCIFIPGIILLAAPGFMDAPGVRGQSSSSPLLQDVSPGELQQIIGSYRGDKAVLVNVWATWCAPCVEEFPYIVELQEAYPDRLQVIFISADFPDSRDRAEAFLKEQGVDWTTYFKTGKDQPFIEALSENWSGALPYTRILGKDGRVVASWEQGAEYEKFRDNVKTAIKK